MSARPSQGVRPDPAAVDPADYLSEHYQDVRLRNAALRWFYAVKPLMPRRLQLAARRLYARRQGRRAFPAWPIESLLVDHRNEQLRRRLRASGNDRLPLVNYWPDKKFLDWARGAWDR